MVYVGIIVASIEFGRRCENSAEAFIKSSLRLIRRENWKKNPLAKCQMLLICAAFYPLFVPCVQICVCVCLCVMKFGLQRHKVKESSVLAPVSVNQLAFKRK